MTRWAFLLTAASVAVATSARSDPAIDMAPRVDHRPITTVNKGDKVVVQAAITTLSGKPVFEPAVFLRGAGFSTFSSIPLKADPAVAGLFSVELPANLVQSDFDYYVEAFDEDGNGPGRVGTPSQPLHVTVMSAPRKTDVPVRPQPQPQTQTQHTNPPPRVATAPPTPPPEKRAPPEAVARPAEGPQRSKAPTVILGVLGGLAAAVAIGAGVAYNMQSSNFSNAANKKLPFSGSSYNQGQTEGLVTMISGGAAIVFVAGALTYGLWPSSSDTKTARLDSMNPTVVGQNQNATPEPPRVATEEASR